MSSPLLGLLGFSGPSQDQQLVGIAAGEWPPRWWKRMMGQEDPPPIRTLPTAVVNGVDSHARTLMKTDMQIRQGDSTAIARTLGASNAHHIVERNDHIRSPSQARADAISELSRRPSGGVDHPPPSFVAATEKDISPWVRDTVFPIVGGPPPSLTVESLSGPSLLTRFILRVTGSRYGEFITPGHPQAGDASPLTHRVRLQNNLPVDAFNDVLTHEVGHVGDFRGNLAWLDRIASDNFRKVPQEEYSSVNPAEYKATLFENGMGSIYAALHQQEYGGDPNDPTGYEDLQKYIQQRETTLPGIGEAIQMLLQYPSLRDTPLARTNRERLDEIGGMFTKAPGHP